jgi:hypothetical protein
MDTMIVNNAKPNAIRSALFDIFPNAVDVPSLKQVQQYVSRNKKRLRGVSNIVSTSDLLEYAKDNNILHLAAAGKLADDTPSVFFMLQGKLLDQNNALVALPNCVEDNIVALPQPPAELLNLRDTLRGIVSQQVARYEVANAEGRLGVVIAEALVATCAMGGLGTLHDMLRDLLSRLQWSFTHNNFTSGVNFKSVESQVLAHKHMQTQTHTYTHSLSAPTPP